MKDFQSGFENFTTVITPAQLEAQYDRQFNSFNNSLYHALREYDPVRAESILFNPQMPTNDPPSQNIPPSVPNPPTYTNPPQTTHTTYYIPDPEEETEKSQEKQEKQTISPKNYRL